MRVLLVTTSYPDAQTGSEAAGGFVADFAEELARFAKVTVVAATAKESSIREEGALLVHRFGVQRWPLSTLKPHRPADWIPLYATLRNGLQTVRDVVAADRPHYILALWALPSGYWARRMLRKFGVPYGTWALGSDIWSLGRIPILRSYLGRVLADGRHRFADGFEIRRAVEGLSGLPCEFLPSARRLPVHRLTNPSSTPPYRLGFLGRWHPNKGVDIFLQALQQLPAEDWARISEVRICGGGPLESDVHRMADNLKAEGRPVSVGGYLDRVSAAEFIVSTDYLALPSRIESIPVVFSDAAQLRRPLVATPVGDLPDLFRRHEYGILAGSTTAEAYSDALIRALRTPANRFRAALDDLSAQFDVGAVAEQFFARIKELES